MGSCSAFDRTQDCANHAFHMVQHLVVPEAKDLPALGFQPGGAGDVRGAGGMVTAVEFNCETGFTAGEVENVGADGELAGKARAVQAEVRP